METHEISSLQERYSLSSRQAIYDRINGLKIKPVLRGRLSSEQLDELDKLDKFLRSTPGATISDFPREADVVAEQFDRFDEAVDRSEITHLSSNSLDKQTDAADMMLLIESIARHIAATRDPLQHYVALERACASGWLLSTAEVRSLVGTKPTGDRFQRGSFVFIRSGKIGAQSAWRVAKVVEGNSYKI
jgi:hypothetical protein